MIIPTLAPLPPCQMAFVERFISGFQISPLIIHASYLYVYLLLKPCQLFKDWLALDVINLFLLILRNY